ncbi:hypothetical protein [Frigoriflavimonas asaccharolytica]|uniref:Uncharacterized protein n=1 Tax=Frigoriflavimonas asaccharolytica TaxID=2735899 RepID=A0A8J8G5W1_9FLAO|nr:hypothetical protein [Frigoriflavimonas asaccharolytica]NRS91809.1 hypothetical protein [Frigoriflavimonas asaccharolytica]
MEINHIRILFFCLIPIGVFALLKGIKLIRKSFSGEVLLEIPFSQLSGQFYVAKAGTFSIWQKGKSLTRTPIDKLRPFIYSELTKEELKLNYSLLSPRINDFSTGRMELFTFYAPIGSYKIELKEGTILFGLQNLIAKAIPSKSIDMTKFYVQIRESQSQVFTFLAIPMIISGMFGIIGGFVLGILADQIIK